MSPPPKTEAAVARLHSPIIGGVDIREVAGCTCLRLRRSSRSATQLFDAHLGQAGLTIGQFGVLAKLYGVSIFRESISIKDLAQQIGLDPTTLVRTLKPLEQHGLVEGHHDPSDRRSRLIRLTPLGRERLAEAMPLWSAAQQALRAQIGESSALALNGLLDLASHCLHSDKKSLDEPPPQR